MCWSEKMCFCVPLNVGCVALGVVNFIISTTMSIASIIHFVEGNEALPKTLGHHILSTFSLELKQMPSDIVFGFVLMLALPWIMFSVILILGILWNKASFILSYFLYGISVVIISQLGALLVLLRSCWMLSGIIIILSLIYVHFLVAVHTVYELMQRGKDFRFHSKQQDNDHLLFSDAEFSTDLQ